MSELVLDNVSMNYQKEENVLQNLNLTVASGEFIALVGPSGSGKTTLLDLICGFEKTTTGKILMDGENLSGLSPKERDVALVFQNYALLPHLTAADNITFGLKIRKVKKAKRAAKLTWVAKMLDLEPILGKLPSELSGGQKQRVALARAIVREPKLFLMDEPLSNLDASLREQTSQEITRLHQELKTTLLYVTHAQDEAMTMADRIVILNQGRIHQIGTPQEVYQQPADLFVATFIGKPKMNIIEGQCQAGYFYYQGLALGKLTYPTAYENQRCYLGIRCENVSLHATEQGTNYEIEQIDYLGQETLYHVKGVAELKLIVRAQGPPTFSVGTKVELVYDFATAHLFDCQTKKRIEEN